MSVQLLLEGYTAVAIALLEVLISVPLLLLVKMNVVGPSRPPNTGANLFDGPLLVMTSSPCIPPALPAFLSAAATFDAVCFGTAG
jgi:hypothetical protein